MNRKTGIIISIVTLVLLIAIGGKIIIGFFSYEGYNDFENKKSTSDTGVFVVVNQQGVYRIGYSCEYSSGGMTNADDSEIDPKEMIRLDMDVEKFSKENGEVNVKISLFDRNDNKIDEKNVIYDIYSEEKLIVKF